MEAKVIEGLSRLMASARFYALANAIIMARPPRFTGKFPPQAKVVHVYRKRKSPDGGYVGLNVSSDLCAQAMRDAGIAAESVGVVDSNSVDGVLFRERPSHLIVKAFWIPKEKLALLARKYPSCKFVVVCHSKPSFLGQEGSGLRKFHETIELSRSLQNVVPACNNEETAAAFSAAYSAPIAWAPNIMPHLGFYEGHCQYRADADPLNVGMFCAIRPFKNVLNQAVAAVWAAEMMGRALRLHVISSRQEMGGDRTVANLRLFFESIGCSTIELVEHEWMPHGEFLELVKSMDAGLQASFTESFNIVAVDFLREGVPIVLSPAIEWAPETLKADPDNLLDISRKLIGTFSMGGWEKAFSLNLGRRRLMLYNKNALLQWSDILDGARHW